MGELVSKAQLGEAKMVLKVQSDVMVLKAQLVVMVSKVQSDAMVLKAQSDVMVLKAQLGEAKMVLKAAPVGVMDGQDFFPFLFLLRI